MTNYFLLKLILIKHLCGFLYSRGCSLKAWRVERETSTDDDLKMSWRNNNLFFYYLDFILSDIFWATRNFEMRRNLRLPPCGFEARKKYLSLVAAHRSERNNIQVHSRSCESLRSNIFRRWKFARATMNNVRLCRLRRNEFNDSKVLKIPINFKPFNYLGNGKRRKQESG